MWWSAYAGVVRRPSQSEAVSFQSEVIDIRKTAEDDASDGFNIESPHLAHTSLTTHWTGIPDMASLASSGSQLPKFKNRSKMPPLSAWLGFLENILGDVNDILHAYRGQSVPQPCWMRRRQLFPIRSYAKCPIGGLLVHKDRKWWIVSDSQLTICIFKIRTLTLYAASKLQ